MEKRKDARKVLQCDDFKSQGFYPLIKCDPESLINHNICENLSIIYDFSGLFAFSYCYGIIFSDLNLSNTCVKESSVICVSCKAQFFLLLDISSLPEVSPRSVSVCHADDRRLRLLSLRLYFSANGCSGFVIVFQFFFKRSYRSVETFSFYYTEPVCQSFFSKAISTGKHLRWQY